jgi:hypothetical protein
MGSTAGTHQGAESETFEEGRMNYHGSTLNYPQGWYLSMYSRLGRPCYNNVYVLYRHDKYDYRYWIL